MLCANFFPVETSLNQGSLEVAKYFFLGKTFNFHQKRHLLINISSGACPIQSEIVCKDSTDANQLLHGFPISISDPLHLAFSWWFTQSITASNKNRKKPQDRFQKFRKNPSSNFEKNVTYSEPSISVSVHKWLQYTNISCPLERSSSSCAKAPIAKRSANSDTFFIAVEILPMKV